MEYLQAQVIQWKQLDATRTALQRVRASPIADSALTPQQELVRKAEDLSEKLKTSQDKTKSLEDDLQKANVVIREHQLSTVSRETILFARAAVNAEIDCIAGDGQIRSSTCRWRQHAGAYCLCSASGRVLCLRGGADQIQFEDSFVTRGTDGGIDAGRQLRAAIQDYHRSLPSHHPDERVVIYVFANLKGLGRASRQANIITDESIFSQFTTGFNASHYLTTFVDAGSQKEAADAKLRAHMDLLYRNCHCQHIIFGGCDNGYAGFLETFAQVGGVNQKVTILDSPLVPHHLRKTLQQFRSISVGGIFRTTKIPSSTFSVDSVLGIKRRAPESLPTYDRRPLSLGHDSSRRSATMSDTLIDIFGNDRIPTVPNFKYGSPRIYCINRNGQRIDRPLVMDRHFMAQLNGRKKKLCNNYYIRGHCSFGALCSHDHSLQLNKLEVDSLRHVARGHPCRDAFCSDAGCPNGHMCNLQNKNHNHYLCKFLPEMHDVDISIVNYVDSVTGEKDLELARFVDLS